MATFVEAVGDIVKTRVCNLLSNPLIDGRQWGPESPFVGEGVATNPLTTNWYNRTIDGMRSVFCNAPVEEVDNTPVPFQGGQCPVGYNVTVSFTRVNGNPGTSQGFFNGPLGGVRVVDQGGGFAQLQIFARDRLGGIVTCGGVQEAGPAWFGMTSGGAGAAPASGSISSSTRCDGQPDNCGDPPPTYNPINVFNFTQNIEYTDNSETTINELGDFNLFAPVFLPGSIQIPFNLRIGEVNFSGSLFPDGTFNITPTLNVEIGGNGNPAPVDDIDFPEDEEYEIEPEEDQEAQIVGAWVIINTDSPRATRVFENGVTHFYPRNGILKFRIAAGNRGFVYSEGIDIKTRRAFIPVPRAGRAIGADFFGYQGSAATVTLAYAQVPIGLIPIPE